MPAQTHAENTPPHPDTHPLLPGVRCAEVWNPDWPRALHDKQLTGFSPLTCGMDRAPAVWAEIDVGGELNGIERVKGCDGADLLLVNDGRLRLISAEGAVRWTSGEGGRLFFFGDLRGNGRDYLLIGGGPRLALLDAATGKTEWTHRCEPPHAQVRVAVADVLPGFRRGWTPRSSWPTARRGASSTSRPTGSRRSSGSAPWSCRASTRSATTTAAISSST